MERFALSRKIERFKTLLDCFSAHVGLEVVTETVLQLCECGILRLEVANLQVAEVIPHAVQRSDVIIEALANCGELLFGRSLGAATLVGLCALSLKRCEILLGLLLTLSDRKVALLLQA